MALRQAAASLALAGSQGGGTGTSDREYHWGPGSGAKDPEAHRSEFGNIQKDTLLCQ